MQPSHIILTQAGQIISDFILLILCVYHENNQYHFNIFGTAIQGLKPESATLQCEQCYDYRGSQPVGSKV